MPFKDTSSPEALASRRRWYHANRDEQSKKATDNRKAYAERNAQYVREIKARTPCMDCGRTFPPCAMDFDHRGDEQKDRCVAVLVRRAVSLKRLQAEIDKCDLVCACCHRVRSEARRIALL